VAGLEDLIAELMAPLGGVSIRRMFGGRGIFKDGLMFALMSSRDVFYFKADEVTAPAFAAEGCEQWTPEMQGRASPMPYWRAPERLFDEPEEFAEWARDAFAAALRTQKAKAAPKKKLGTAKPKAAVKTAAKGRSAGRG
jgi:DNA transformation protein and related proteins